MGLTHEDVERILRIIDESGYDDVRVEYGDLKLHVRRHGGGEPAAPTGAAARPPSTAKASVPAATPSAPPGASVAAPTKALSIPSGALVVRAPMLGTFYRSPSPGAPPFVEEGSDVRPETTVCLIEVMKLFNSLKAGVEGRVVQFLAENGAMVEYDQPLIVIEPKAKE